MTVKIGEKAPNFGVSEWVQGAPTNFDQEKDHIVLLDCLLYTSPSPRDYAAARMPSSA